MKTMMLAQGKALALIATLMHRDGIVSADEFGNLLGMLAVTQDDIGQSAILAQWAAMVKDAALAIEGGGSSPGQ